MPAASAASTTSGSRRDPPGWMIAVTPAPIAISGPSEKGKNASEAQHRAGQRLQARLVDGQAHGVHAAHLARADARRRLLLGEHDRVGAHVHADLPGEHEVAPLVVGRRALGDDLHLRAVGEVDVAVLYEQPAHDLLDVRLGQQRRAALVVLQDAQRRLAREDLHRAVLVAGREQHLDELLGEALGGGRVDRAVERDHAAEGAQRIGRQGALVGLLRGRADRRPTRVVVLDDHARGLVNSRTIARAESRSTRLLNDSCLPWCCWMPDRMCVRAPTCW